MHRFDVLEHLTAAVRAAEPDQVLVTGDLVHVGLPAEIDSAGRWLETLGVPEQVMLVPGNHDVYAEDSWPAMRRAWGAYLGAAAELGADGYPLERQLARGGVEVTLIGLSSAIPSPLFAAYGRLGDTQRAKLETALAGAGGLRCVLVHHPPLPAMTHRRKCLLDAGQLSVLLCRQGAELVLHGHTHRNVGRIGPGDARIYGTASASSAIGELASYRCFDLSAVAGRLQVDMTLVEVAADGSTRIAAEESWRVPVRPATARVAAP